MGSPENLFRPTFYRQQFYLTAWNVNPLRSISLLTKSFLPVDPSELINNATNFYLVNALERVAIHVSVFFFFSSSSFLFFLFDQQGRFRRIASILEINNFAQRAITISHVGHWLIAPSFYRTTGDREDQQIRWPLPNSREYYSNLMEIKILRRSASVFYGASHKFFFSPPRLLSPDLSFSLCRLASQIYGLIDSFSCFLSIPWIWRR